MDKHPYEFSNYLRTRNLTSVLTREGEEPGCRAGAGDPWAPLFVQATNGSTIPAHNRDFILTLLCDFITSTSIGHRPRGASHFDSPEFNSRDHNRIVPNFVTFLTESRSVEYRSTIGKKVLLRLTYTHTWDLGVGCRRLLLHKEGTRMISPSEDIGLGMSLPVFHSGATVGDTHAYVEADNHV